MPSLEQTKRLIADAFARVKYPGDGNLCGSTDGDEPIRVNRDFRGKNHWQSLRAQFIDESPDGLASALSMFSHEAFRFYLPAYLLADLDNKLQRSDPVFHLTHGLDESSAGKPINPRRYGRMTWADYAQERFAGFTPAQAAAIVGYLQYKLEEGGEDYSRREDIQEALQRYWTAKAS